MRKYKIKFEDDAKVHKADIIAWYRNIDRKLAIRFRSELDKTIEIYAKHPKIGHPITPTTRKMTTKTFQYNIFYQIDEPNQMIQILAIRHQKRDIRV
ncbi:MAG: type II toxin-antitoxin system RelE/ParE family toxin [Bacteroidales bacterium]|nr:type II toxin-antitoxin system RelE/ParE family toxin [Bacteroidales bacterium]